RQPIMDATNRLIGYDLLVHGSEWSELTDDAQARRDGVQRTLMHVFVDLGIERLVGTADAFMSLPRAALAVASSLPITGNRAVIGIDIRAPLDQDTVNHIGTLRRKGFRIALENAAAGVQGPLMQRALENAQFAKFAIGDRPDPAALKGMRSYGLRAIVTGIDDRELLQAATALGCDGFQGCYLCEPESVVSTSLR